MIHEASTGVWGAVLGTSGLVAQVTVPIPDDLKSWPVTAILGLVTLASLTLVAWQTYSSAKAAEVASKAAVASATAMQEQAREISGVTFSLREVTRSFEAFTAQIKARPCFKE